MYDKVDRIERKKLYCQSRRLQMQFTRIRDRIEDQQLNLVAIKSVLEQRAGGQIPLTLFDINMWALLSSYYIDT